MEFEIRPENIDDFGVVSNLLREAFWNLYKPGCDEHYLVHQLRKSGSYVTELAFVACKDGEVVGYIGYSRAKVVDAEGNETEVLCLGPVAVWPEQQHKGIGGKLIRHTLQIAAELAFKGVILFGNPDYYKRFGFVNAAEYAITTSDGANFGPFMALELVSGSLHGVSGRFIEDKAFHYEQDEVDAYDKQFPFKEKKITDTQL